MKRIFLTSLAFIGFYFSYAQHALMGKIVDGENGTPIANAFITNVLNNEVSVSNRNGEFEVQSTGSYQITKEGYQEKEISTCALRQFGDTVVSNKQVPKVSPVLRGIFW